MTKPKGYYNEKRKSDGTSAYSIRELLYIFSPEGCADLHFYSQGRC